MKKIIVFTILACLCVSQPAQAEEKKRYCHSSSRDYINPVLAGVKRVVVAVDRVGLGKNLDDKLPDPLKKASLEKLLKELYEERFTSRNGTYLSTATKGCHDRNDQLVEVIDLAVVGGREAFEEETKKEDTLSVILFVNVIQQTYAGMDMSSDIFTFYIAQLRPGVDEYKKAQGMTPYSITTSTDEKRISEIIRSVLKNKIH